MLYHQQHIATNLNATNFFWVPKGPRGDWSDGYGFITQPGFCPCDASLDAYEDEHCPSSSSDPTAADVRLLESLLGRRRLPLMKRMGRIPFIRVCE
jgi:hypothetical protein